MGDWIVGDEKHIDDYRRVDGDWRVARRRVDRYFDLAPLAPGGSGTPDQVES